MVELQTSALIVVYLVHLLSSQCTVLTASRLMCEWQWWWCW